MILRCIFIFILLLASVGMGIQLQRDPGYLFIEFHHWTLETSLGVAIPCLLLFLFLFYYALALGHWLWNLPTYWEQWILKRRVLNAQAKTRRGLIDFSEGHWLQAKNNLIKALPFSDAPLLNYLTAARAAQEMGDHTLRDHYLREAQQCMPEAKIAVELTQAQLQLANQQWEQALATLRHIQDLAPNHPYVLKLLMKLYEEIRDWPQMIALLPLLKQHRVIQEEPFHLLQHQAYLQAFIDLIKQNQKSAIEKFIQELPKGLALNADIMVEYGRYLISQHQEVKAEGIIKRCLQQRMTDDLLDLYGQIHVNPNQLKFAESLLKKAPFSSTLLLCLGRLCVQQQLWGKAKSYFEESIQQQPCPKAYAELGQLLDHLGESQEACIAYQQGLFFALK